MFKFHWFTLLTDSAIIVGARIIPKSGKISMMINMSVRLFSISEAELQTRWTFRDETCFSDQSCCELVPFDDLEVLFFLCFHHKLSLYWNWG